MGLVPELFLTAAQPKPLVSVCIANYNGATMLRDCLDSVLRQEGDITLEIIVHDDASTDASVEVLSDYPEVRLLQSSKNVGFCKANNRMVAIAAGRYVLLLNNDAALLPDALATLLAAENTSPSTQILTLPQYDWESGRLVDRGCLLDPFYTPVPNLNLQRSEVAYVIGACLWISRAAWVELGGFPEWMESIGEDLYLCCQARIRGLSVQALKTSGYRHRQGVSFGGNRVADGRLQTNFRRRYLSERNRLVTALLCSPAWLRWPWWAVLALALLLEAFLLSLSRRSGDVCQRIYWPATRDSVSLWRTATASGRAIPLPGDIGTRRFLAAFVPWPAKLRLLFRHGVPRIEG